jgi:signal transduction histidine kinase
MANHSIKILLVTRSEQTAIAIHQLLKGCYADDLHLRQIADFDLAVEAMGRNEEDVYLIDDYPSADQRHDDKLPQAHSVDDDQQWDNRNMALLRAGIAQGCLGPIILLSDDSRRQSDEQAMALGAADYVVKADLDASRLDCTIRHAIQRKQTLSRLREVRKRLIQAREAELLMLAQQLHEGPLQDMIGIRFYLGAIEEAVQEQQAREQLVFVQENLQSVIQMVRNFCVELRPPTLEPFGLEKAIRASIRRFQKKFPQLAIELDLDRDAQRLSSPIRLTFFRIFQQALLNISEHARASHLVVTLRLNAQQVVLTIQDDGVGFDPPASPMTFVQREQVGLLFASEYVKAISGYLTIHSYPGGGTTLVVTAPFLN